MPEPEPRPYAVVIDSWLYYATSLKDGIDAITIRLEGEEFKNSGFAFLFQYFEKCGYRQIRVYMRADNGKAILAFKDDTREPWLLPKLNTLNSEISFLNTYLFEYFYTNWAGIAQRREFRTNASNYENAYSDARDFVEKRVKRYCPPWSQGFLIRFIGIE